MKARLLMAGAVLALVVSALPSCSRSKTPEENIPGGTMEIRDPQGNVVPKGGTTAADFEKRVKGQ